MLERMKGVQKLKKKKGKWMKQLATIVLTICMLAGVMPTGFEVLKPLETEAANFVPRTVGPETSNAYYFSSNNPFYPSLAPSPGYIDSQGNCTWYAWGRAYEILGTRPNLSTASAGKWYDYNRDRGYYAYGSQPKLGAVACWSNHVAVVEEIYGNGTILISESSYICYHYPNGLRFQTRVLNASNPQNGNDTFYGYIYACGDLQPTPTANGTVTGVVTDNATNIKSHTATINGHAVITGGEIAAGEMAVYFAINETQSGGKVGEYWDLSGGSNGRIDFLYNTDDKRFNFVLKEGTRYWYQVYAFSKSSQTEFAGGWKSFVTAIDFTPQNLGNTFYAYIKSKDSNMYISNPSVSSDSETAAQLKQKASGGTNNELWCFTRMSNGAYRIQSVFDSRFMCPWNGSVYAGYASTTYWYIQKDMGGYRLRQFEYAASGLGVSSKTEGAAISFCDVKPSVASQIFDIQVVAPEAVNFRPSAATSFGNHVYEMYDSCVNWTQANAIAKKKGGHLVTITNSDEMDFLRSFMKNSQYSGSMDASWWMGYKNVVEEGTWEWTTGETSTYTNWWVKNLPGISDDEMLENYYRSLKGYAVLWGGYNFAWKDATGKEGYGFIVEYDNLQTMVPVQTMTYNGHRYELYDIPVNKATAAGWANQKGGYLATITSSQEMAQISAMAKKSTFYKNNLYGWYIGLGRDGATNTFKWGKTGEVFSYKNWTPGEPNFANQNEYSVVVCGENASTWNDVPGESYFGFVIEYDEDWNPELKISAPEEVLPGETFDVSISISAEPAVASTVIDLLYDNSLLKIVPADFDRDEDLMQYNAVRNLDYKENAIRFTAADIHGIDWSNKVFTVTFRVKENVKRGTLLSFEIENADQDMLAVNGYSRPAGAVRAGATVLVGPKYRLGDVDEDGKVAVADALAILMYLADKEVAKFDKDLADVDKDGKVAVADALAILMHLADKKPITE